MSEPFFSRCEVVRRAARMSVPRNIDHCPSNLSLYDHNHCFTGCLGLRARLRRNPGQAFRSTTLPLMNKREIRIRLKIQPMKPNYSPSTIRQDLGESQPKVGVNDLTIFSYFFARRLVSAKDNFLPKARPNILKPPLLSI